MNFGSYELLELVGTGGMGEVWRAEQRSPVQRVVAVKLIKAGMDTRELIARFESERQALAMMNHPAIARVFDAGSTDALRPYFAMEFVPGTPINVYRDERNLSVRERLKIFMRVCEGVQHAHQKAVIHRDLKPTNILITEVDGQPAPKIIDFGVARALSQRLTAATFLTHAGAIVGTPDYMSPEQASSSGEDIDTRTDLYSLGVILYELLTGALPQDLRKLPFDEMLRKLRDGDPPRPSVPLAGLSDAAMRAQQRGTEAGVLVHQLRGDLDAIVMKALDKDPAGRYESASLMADDIRHYLRSEPVLARPATLRYQARKYVRRHYAAFGVAALVAVLLTSFGITQAIQIRRVTRERDRADRVARFMTTIFRVSNPSQNRGTQITAREILDQASRDIESGLANDPELQAEMMSIMGDSYEGLGLYPQAESLLAASLKTRRRIFGPEHLATAASLHDLSAAVYQLGRYAEADRLEQEALEIRRRRLGAEHPDTLRSMNNVARCLVKQGHYGEAEKLHRQILETRRRVLGAEHPDTLVSLDSLGATLDDEGRYAEAEKLERETLAIKRRVLGSDHPETLRTLHHVADTAYAQGRYADAEKLHREELAALQRVLGPEHSETLNAMVALANALDDEGRYSEAEKLNRKAMNIQLRVLGPEHFNTLVTMNNEAEILVDEGHYKQAGALHRQVIMIRSRVLGPEHSHTLYSMSKLAWTLLMEGRLNEAEPLSRGTRDKQARVPGPDHPETAETQYNLACIAARRGRREDAIWNLQQAFDHVLKPRTILRISNDPNLKPLHRDRVFTPLVAHALERTSSPSHPR